MREGLVDHTGASAPRAAVVLCVLLCGCDGNAPAPPVTEEGVQPSESAERNFEDGLYERNVVFMTVGADSAIIVPWFFRASSSEEGVERVVEGWLRRMGLWEPIFRDQWSSEPTPTPSRNSRIQPRGPVDLVVDVGGALQRILFAQGQRQLEVVIEGGMSDWSGNRGETFRVHRGAALFGDQRVEGVVLDMSRARFRDGPEPGEWMFLAGPGRLAILIVSPGGSPAYTAWGRRGEEEFRWPEVQVIWRSVMSFEEARRDVPVEWQIRSLSGDLQITLASAGLDGDDACRVCGMELRAVAGEGPILPVDGLFQVTGSIVLDGDSLEVRGLVRHVQG